MESKVWMWIGIFILVYLLYKLFASRGFDPEFNKEINDILTKDEYKVKGRNE